MQLGACKDGGERADHPVSERLAGLLGPTCSGGPSGVGPAEGQPVPTGEATKDTVGSWHTSCRHFCALCGTVRTNSPHCPGLMAVFTQHAHPFLSPRSMGLTAEVLAYLRSCWDPQCCQGCGQSPSKSLPTPGATLGSRVLIHLWKSGLWLRTRLRKMTGELLYLNDSSESLLFL